MIKKKNNNNNPYYGYHWFHMDGKILNLNPYGSKYIHMDQNIFFLWKSLNMLFYAILLTISISYNNFLSV